MAWQEINEMRQLQSKTFVDTENPFRYRLKSSMGIVHYKTGGLGSKDPWLDIDLSNANDLKALYTLIPAASGIGYIFTPREPDNTRITISMTNTFISKAQKIKEYRNGGVIYFPNIDTDLDVYMKPFPHRYGIFKVLKSANAVKTFTFTGSWTADPISLTMASGKITSNIRQAIKDGLSGVQDVYFNRILIPKRIAWDATGNLVPVQVSIKGATLVETVVPNASHAYPITVDTDVSYDAAYDTGIYMGGDLGVSYANVRSGDVDTYGLFSSPASTVGQQRTGASPYYYSLYRMACRFDTSALPDTAIISASDINLYLAADNSGTNFNITIVPYTGGFPLNGEDDGYESDWKNIGSTDYGSLSTNGIGTGWKSIPLNATGIAAISKTGNTDIGLRSSADISGTTPTNVSTVYFYTSSIDPEYIVFLDVTYTVPPNVKVNVGGVWKTVSSVKVNIGGVWKDVTSVKVNIGGTWKTV